jgi:hypothetical protein
VTTRECLLLYVLLFECCCLEETSAVLRELKFGGCSFFWLPEREIYLPNGAAAPSSSPPTPYEPHTCPTQPHPSACGSSIFVDFIAVPDGLKRRTGDRLESRNFSYPARRAIWVLTVRRKSALDAVRAETGLFWGHGSVVQSSGASRDVYGACFLHSEHGELMGYASRALDWTAVWYSLASQVVCAARLYTRSEITAEIAFLRQSSYYGLSRCRPISRLRL